MELPQFIELLKIKTDESLSLTLLKSRYNRYATRYNKASGQGESVQISLFYQLEGLKKQIERIQSASNGNNWVFSIRIGTWKDTAPDTKGDDRARV